MSQYYIVQGNINKQVLYISNTNPIIWSEGILGAKKFYDLEKLRSELDESYKTLIDGIKYTKLESIHVIGYDDVGHCINRYKYL